MLDHERGDKEIEIVALNAIGELAEGVFEWDTEGDFIEYGFEFLTYGVGELLAKHADGRGKALTGVQCTRDVVDRFWEFVSEGLAAMVGKPI